ncbi:MAG TPA: hypothetical protein VJA21_01720 [Verrucomicrobiae bacterium]
MRVSESTARFWFTARFVFWVALTLWCYVSWFYRTARRDGVGVAFLLLGGSFALIEVLLWADRRLRRRKGMRWVSRFYLTIVWVCVAVVLITGWWIVKS